MSKLRDYLAINPPLRQAVVGFLVRGDKVLLGVRIQVSDDLGHLVVAGIGGGLEPGEDSEQALQREVEEEIRVHITEWHRVGRVVCLSPHKPTWNLGIDYYIVTGFKGNPEKTDVIAPRWYPKEELPLSDMWPDNRITVPLALDGKRIAGTFLYADDGQIVEHDLRELAPDESIPEIVA